MLKKAWGAYQNMSSQNCFLPLLNLMLCSYAGPAVPYTPSTVQATSYTATRPDGRSWTLYSAHADYDAAVSICEAKGQKLVSLHSQSDAQSLAGLAANLPFTWSPGFGLPVSSTYMRVGAIFDTSKQQYTWQDGTPFDWLPASFGTGSAPAGRNCVAVASNGTWTPVHCSRQPLSFACQSGSYVQVSCPHGTVKDTAGECGE